MKFLFCVQLKSKVADYINLIFFFFALGIWLGIWMSQLEEKYK